ncbi:hydroxyacid dehydrogenase [Streptomyces sp. NEAU-W12]|uniref:hydroxyacid dehydrogenase n=1 Tax=Streptomyces sp. NEAU-W12 TaxID=2994668 RepID=UPI00224A6296|nr:hydroxyacid dehydrogenase [Streptomyces sp. NEAU-W12]MCX2928225.1 hydroxyacid dehydrogenase [Streptomyces sp. NEAU-W12]
MPTPAPPPRPRAATALAPVLREEVFGPRGMRELADAVDVVAEAPDVRTLLTDPRRAEVEVLVTSWGAPALTPDVLDELPALHTVAHAAGSVRKLVTDAVWGRGITVISAAEANNEPVAEFVYAHVVLALKDVYRRSRHMAAVKALPPVDDVPGTLRQTVGLVSFGSVARKVAQRLRRLDTRVLAWDPYLPPDVFDDFQVARAFDLSEVVARSRVLSIHTPLIPGSTEKLVTGELLRLLPAGATLINTARGAVIDEQAMIEVLTERPDLSAVLDVTAEEPPPADSALYTLPNVMLTGHVAGTVGGERRAMGRLVVDELRRIGAGLSPLHAVTAEAAPLRA